MAAATAHSFHLAPNAGHVESDSPSARVGIPVPALRVSQLDAAELDTQVTQYMANMFQDIVRYWPVTSATVALHFDWLRVIIKLSINAIMIRRQAATYGMHLLGLCYRRCVSSQPQLVLLHHSSLSSGRSAMMLVGMTLQACVESVLLGSVHSSHLWSRRLATAGALLQLLTYLSFLQRGLFQWWWERLFAVRKVYRDVDGAGARPPTFEFIQRELMWHNAAELLSVVLPLGRKALHGWREWLGLKNTVPTAGCPVCGDLQLQQPIFSHSICRHAVCYYCVVSKMASTGFYQCPICFCQTTAYEQLEHCCCQEKITNS